jgi:hypothetical protein
MNRQLDQDCVTCGRRFHPTTLTAQYCSNACRQKEYRKRYRDRNAETPKPERTVWSTFDANGQSIEVDITDEVDPDEARIARLRADAAKHGLDMCDQPKGGFKLVDQQTGRTRRGCAWLSLVGVEMRLREFDLT